MAKNEKVKNENKNENKEERDTRHDTPYGLTISKRAKRRMEQTYKMFRLQQESYGR